MIRSLKDIKLWAYSKMNLNFVSKEDINYLLQETFSLKPYELLLKENELLDDHLFIEFFERVNNGEPLYYVLGKAPFYGLNFKCKRGVTLIPRNETEELVSMAIEDINKFGFKKVLDIGTGTGCIALSIKKNVLEVEVHALDISKEALEVAEINKKHLGVDVKLFLGDCLENVEEKYDLIVSNPPYIDRDSFVQESVINYEPHIALFADNHGLMIYEKIFSKIDNCLNYSSEAIFEISPDLVDGLVNLLNKYLPKYTYSFYKDMNHFIRFLKIRKDK